MAYTLLIRDAAVADAKDAYWYYESKQPGLGERFLEELLQRYFDISRHPEYFTFIDEQKIIRDIRLKHFPYLVVYEIIGDTVVVYSVHNCYRNPDKRFGR